MPKRSSTRSKSVTTRRKPVPSRAVDLGREEELVTWSEWLGRSMSHMAEVVPEEQRDRLQFMVTLHEGRSFLVRQVLTHVVRGRCSLERTRWDDQGAICDIITGYLLIGENDEGDFTAVSVPPTAISSIECILKKCDERSPFGFHKREILTLPAEQKQIEEVSSLAAFESP
jgi:hypothetical protein